MAPLRARLDARAAEPGGAMVDSARHLGPGIARPISLCTAVAVGSMGA